MMLRRLDGLEPVPKCHPCIPLALFTFVHARRLDGERDRNPPAHACPPSQSGEGRSLSWEQGNRLHGDSTWRGKAHRFLHASWLALGKFCWRPRHVAAHSSRATVVPKAAWRGGWPNWRRELLRPSGSLRSASNKEIRRQPRPVLPKPPEPRTVSGSASTRSHFACVTGAITICAMRSPREMTNGSWP